MTTEYTRRAVIVVEVSVKDRANSIAQGIDPIGGERTFTVPLYPAGLFQVTPTHYWCSTACRPHVWTQIQEIWATDSDRSKGRVYDGDLWTPEQVLADMGLEVAAPRL